jgi:hypothetical protein
MLPSNLLVALAALWTSHAWARSHDAGQWTGLTVPEPLVRSDFLLHASNATGQRKSRATKRADPTFAEFELNGRWLDCLMRNTQAGADAYAAQNPWLANKQTVAQFTTAPKDIIDAEWKWEDPDPTSVDTGKTQTADARNDIGGTATDENKLCPVRLAWIGPDVATRTGEPYVSHGLNGLCLSSSAVAGILAQQDPEQSYT